VEGVDRGPPLAELLHAAVGVEEPRLEVEDDVADRAHPEVAGLDDAGVDRPDRDLENALAFDREVRELVCGNARGPRLPRRA
jgi:hypothetical protein